MKTSLKNCLSIQAGLIALSESKMLDLKNSFAVAKNIRALEPVIESFNEETYLYLRLKKSINLWKKFLMNFTLLI